MFHVKHNMSLFWCLNDCCFACTTGSGQRQHGIQLRWDSILPSKLLQAFWPDPEGAVLQQLVDASVLDLCGDIADRLLV